MSLDFDRTLLLLEQTQTQLALVEEKKAENELEFKREIKYLLESWLQTKNGTQQQCNCQDVQRYAKMILQPTTQ